MKKFLLLLSLVLIPASVFAADINADIQKQREEQYAQFKKDMKWYNENKKQEEEKNATKTYELNKQPMKNNFMTSDAIFVQVIPR